MTTSTATPPPASASSGPLAEPLLNAQDVSALLGIPRSSVYEYVRTHRLPCLRVGRHVRFVRSDLEAWLDDQRVEAHHRLAG